MPPSGDTSSICTLKLTENRTWGHFFIAIDVDAFVPVSTFKECLSLFVEEVRLQPRLPGIDRIYVPGEIEFAASADAAIAGVVVAEAGQEEMRLLAVRFNAPSLEDRSS